MEQSRAIFMDIVNVNKKVKKRMSMLLEYSKVGRFLN